MSTRKKIDAGWFLIPAVMAVFIFAMITWLSTPDSYTDASGVTHTITGWEAIRVMHTNFFTWVWLGLIGVGIFGSLAYFNESGAGKIGRWLRGDRGVTIILVILALACLIVPWVPAMSAKTEGGVFQQKKYQTSYYETIRTVPDAHMVCGLIDCTNGILFKGRQNSQSYKTGFTDQENMARSCRINTYMGWRNDVQTIWSWYRYTNLGGNMVFIRWSREYMGTETRVVLYRNNSTAGYSTAEDRKLATYRPPYNLSIS